MKSFMLSVMLVLGLAISASAFAGPSTNMPTDLSFIDWTDAKQVEKGTLVYNRLYQVDMVIPRVTFYIDDRGYRFAFVMGGGLFNMRGEMQGLVED